MLDAERQKNGRVSSLSAREAEVLEMAAVGLTNREIADRLGVTVHAVKFHLASIYAKLAVSNRTQAAVAFMTATAQAGAQSQGFSTGRAEGAD